MGTQSHIRVHFVRGHYDGIADALRDLVDEGLFVRANVMDEAGPWRGDWYIHKDDVPLLARLDHDWSPRTVLLSPFDNLICDRARTLAMWGFDYTIEIYVPKSRRKYGYYVMPILHGDRLVGRVDPEDGPQDRYANRERRPRRRAREVGRLRSAKQRPGQ